MPDRAERRVQWVREETLGGGVSHPRLINFLARTDQDIFKMMHALVDEARAPDVEVSEALGAPRAVELAARVYGTPHVPDPVSAADEAVVLLQTAAEIEHSLLVQYLYAGFAALDQDIGDGINPNFIIRTIAVQEMGHLMTVQNLRLVLGAEPHFRRQDEFRDNSYDPYPFVREPLSANSLAKYVSAEAPDVNLLSEKEREQVKEIAKVAQGAAGVPVIHRVGLVYMRLFYLFQDSDAPQDPWPVAATAGAWGERWHVEASDIKPAGKLREALAADWHVDSGLIGDEIKDTASARTALHAVAAQGEGSETEPDSHFRRFLALYLKVVAAGAPPTAPIPVIGIDGVSAEPAASLLKLFDIRYELLLINLQQLFLYERSNPVKLEILGWCRQEMKFVMARLYRLMLKQPRRAGGTPDRDPAAPAFAMPSAIVPLDRATLVARLKSALDSSDHMVQTSVAAGAPKTDQAFAVIKTLDDKRRAGIARL